MTLRARLTPAVPPADDAAAAAARAHGARLTKPTGALGRLESLVEAVASVTGEARPRLDRRATLLFAADHPVADLGVSAYPRAVTRAMVRNFAAGGAAASVLAARHRAPLYVVDVGVDGPDEVSAPGTHRDPVADATEGDLVHQDGMSEAVASAAVEAGRAAYARAGAPSLVILGEMGIGNTTLASALCAGLFGEPAERWVGRGTGVDDAGHARKLGVVRQALARVDGAGPLPPERALTAFGGRELAALVGAAAAAVEHRAVVLVDGFIVTAAVAVLLAAAPSARGHFVFAHRSDEQAHARLLDLLGAAPLLSLGLRLGEGSGALLALPVLDAALALHDEMATFEAAGVPDREDAAT